MRPYEELIVDTPNYPKPGVVFKDLTPAFADADAFAAMVDDLAAHFADRGITKVVGAEARGFIVGAAVALRLGAGFVPCRKPGKLPRTVLRESYALEYGTDVLEIHADALTSDDVVLIVDDLVATGGTTTAMVRLVRASGARLGGPRLRHGARLSRTPALPSPPRPTPRCSRWSPLIRQLGRGPRRRLRRSVCR